MKRHLINLKLNIDNKKMRSKGPKPEAFCNSELFRRRRIIKNVSAHAHLISSLDGTSIHVHSTQVGIDR